MTILLLTRYMMKQDGIVSGLLTTATIGYVQGAYGQSFEITTSNTETQTVKYINDGRYFGMKERRV